MGKTGTDNKDNRRPHVSDSRLEKLNKRLSSVKFRGMGPRDHKQVQAIIDQYDFKFDLDHAELLVVAEQDDKIIGVGHFVTILEATFLTDKNARMRDRVEATKVIVEAGTNEAKLLGYDMFHSFVQEGRMSDILKRRFGFETANGEVLIKRVDEDGERR